MVAQMSYAQSTRVVCQYPPATPGMIRKRSCTVYPHLNLITVSLVLLADNLDQRDLLQMIYFTHILLAQLQVLQFLDLIHFLDISGTCCLFSRHFPSRTLFIYFSLDSLVVFIYSSLWVSLITGMTLPFFAACS